jgi:PQQ-dependent dehydrogenase (s-GDH family)
MSLRFRLAALLPLFPLLLTAQIEPFSMTVLNRKPPNPDKYFLAHPFEIICGPDDYLYVTEKTGRILRIDPVTGIRTVLLDHRAATRLTISRNGAGVATSVGQDGMMGMALHPGFGLGFAQDYIFVAYSYSPGNLRISRFDYTGGPSPQLINEAILIEGIPSSNDHSSGRLIFGSDQKLYYSCGDQGYNQFGNRCNEIRSQKVPSAAQIAAGNYSYYSGKVLRINPDGTIPPDNPVFAGVRSHIYTIGHRNPQGLVTEKTATDGASFATPAPGGRLFSSEHGPRTDDEINILEAGGNYGWPYIAGYLDNLNYVYIIWATSASCASTPYSENTIPAGALIRQETDSVLSNFREPVSTLYTVCNPLPVSVCNAGGTDWMKYPTIAPSSVDYYAVNGGLGIPNWYPSLLVPTLRRGVLYRYKLNAAQNGFDSDSIPYFRTANRYRDIAISRNGQKIYLLTDSIGTTSGPSGTGTTALANPGSILEFQYTGSLLALTDDSLRRRNIRQVNTRIFPNPATDYIQVQVPDAAFVRPTRYQLVDVAGRVVMSGATGNKNFKMDIRNIQKGVYILTLSNGYGMVTEKLKIFIRR